MICLPCHQGDHHACTNMATCPCQHRKTVHMVQPDGSAVSSPLSERNALLDLSNASKTFTLIEEPGKLV
jgi:hypothetical protein